MFEVNWFPSDRLIFWLNFSYFYLTLVFICLNFGDASVTSDLRQLYWNSLGLKGMSPLTR